MEDDGIGRETMENSPSRTTEQVEEEGASGGRGLITQLISSMVSTGTENAETEHEKVEEEGKSGGGGGGGGGIFENLISNLSSPKSPKSGVKFFETSKDDQETANLKDNDSGGGVIDKIVSHISENEAPEVEEASILMQSAIRD